MLLWNICYMLIFIVNILYNYNYTGFSSGQIIFLLFIFAKYSHQLPLYFNTYSCTIINCDLSAKNCNIHNMHSIHETDKNNLFFCTCNNDEISALIIVLMLAIFHPFFTTNIFIYVQHFKFMYNTLYLFTTL